MTDLCTAEERVISRLLGDPIPWHASLAHRWWFRTTFVDGDQTEPMADDEAAVLDHVYSHRAVQPQNASDDSRALGALGESTTTRTQDSAP